MDIFNVNAKGFNYDNNDRIYYSTIIVGIENAQFRAAQLEEAENITFVEIVSITTGEVVHSKSKINNVI